MSIALEFAPHGAPARRATGLAEGEAGVDDQLAIFGVRHGIVTITSVA
jgi:hypothetical protein